MSRFITMIAIAAAIGAGASGPAWAQQAAAAPAACAPSRRVLCPTAEEILAVANQNARQAPQAARFEHARQIYNYAPGAIYRLYASPNYVSIILLEQGEAVTAIAAGDTSRWMVTEAEAEAERAPRAIVLIKPSSANIETNIAIITDRRTYLVEAQARTGNRYTAEMAWRYGESEAMALHAAPETLNSSYRVRTVRGRRPSWTPTAVFDDGRRTWIAFSANIATGDLPPLFVITPEGAELANYRVNGARIIIDRVFDVAELRLGARAPIVVRIERDPRAQGRAGLGRARP